MSFLPLRRKTGSVAEPRDENHEIPRFEPKDITDKKVIGRGAFSTVYVGRLSTNRVVLKELFDEDGSEEILVKEAKLLNQMKHEQVVRFLGLSLSPPALMLEYVSFSFQPFGRELTVNCLKKLLKEVSTYEVCNYQHLIPVIADQIAKGVKFLHDADVVHRDLKPANILVSNQHYQDCDGEALQIQWETKPITCKLTDFGESRSNIIQTNKLVTTVTNNIHRGTPTFMAPEIIIPEQRRAMSNKQLKEVDIWALGQVFFNLINPTFSSPYFLEFKAANVEPHLCINHMENMMRGKKLPISEAEFHPYQEGSWAKVKKASDLCRNFEPMSRPSITEVVNVLSKPDIRSTEEKEIMVTEDQVVMELSLDIPFLNDTKTVEYVGESKTLHLLCGPPGSGKSSLATAIFEKFPEKVAICSAEEHIPQGEKPPFSRQMLKKANTDCQQCVRDSCKAAFPIVIVDNTNASLLSVKNYSSIGHEFDYVDVLAVPQTSWILDAQELVKRSSRGFPLEDVQRKLEKFQEPVYPRFYGWFVNGTDSETMRGTGKTFYERCLSKRELREEFTKYLLPDASGKTPDPENYFSSENYTVGPVMLHCTAFYSNYGEVSQSEAYATQERVKADNGKAFTIKVIGLLVTPRSLGLRLKLEDEELLLWPKDDEGDKVAEDGAEETCDSAAGEKSKPWDDECIITHLSPTCGTGSRAHFSLGSGPGVEAVQTGLDLEEIIKMEQEAVRMKRSHTVIALDGATAVGYGEGNWMVYLDEACSTEALFAGYF